MVESIGDRGVLTNKLRIEVHDDSDMEEAREVNAVREAPPLSGCNHNRGGIGTNRRRLLSKQLSMKETTREAKWEKRRQQIQRRSSMVSVVRGKSAVQERHHVVRSSSERAMRCLTDEDLDELRGSFELGFGFDEETGGAHLRNTLPALDFYFAVNRQLSDPKLRTLPSASPTSTLSAVSSSSTLPDTPSPRSPSDVADDGWKIFSPDERLRHWAQVVACSIKHGC
nr:unnamed protein product [Digitaria exilis]